MSAAPGWYPDPERQGRQRFWDGQAWTDQSRPWQSPRAETPPPRSDTPSTAPRRRATQTAGPLPAITQSPAQPERALTSATMDLTPKQKTRPGRSEQVRWTVVDLMAMVPLLAGALAVIMPVAYALYTWRPPAALIPFLLWLAAASLWVVPAVQTWALSQLACRQPNKEEWGRLEEPWRRAYTRAGVHGYQLMLLDSSNLNACTTIGRVVAVTTTAVTLPGDRLEAVLAHELAHTSGWHRGLEYVNAVLMLPIRTLWWLLRVLWAPVRPMWRRAVAWHRPIGFLLTFLLVAAAALVSVVVGAPAAVAWGCARLSRLVRSSTEAYADATVVRSGYGPYLLAALEEHLDRSSRPEEAIPLPPSLVRRATALRLTLDP